MKKITRFFIVIATIVITTNTQAQVGIGTTSPLQELHIAGTDPATKTIRIDALNAANSAGNNGTDLAPLSVNANGDIVIGSASNNDWSITGNTGTTVATNFLGTIDNNALAIRTNNNERIRVATDGKVGISETNPVNATLEVGGNLIIGDTYTGGNAVAQQGGLTIEGRTIIGEDDFFYANLDKFVVYGNTNWIPTAVTNGDNGSGLRYAINAYTSDGTGIYAEDNDGGRGVEASVAGTTANRPVGLQGYDTSGTGRGVLGISANHATTPTDGFIGVQGVESTTSNFAIVASGDFGHTGAIVNLSDKRLKRNIKSMDNALSIINKIEPKYYEMKWDDKKYKNMGLSRTPQMGFIAQELEQILPSLVVDKKMPLNDNIYTKKELIKNPTLTQREGTIMDVKMVNYVQMVPLLTQAIKEQQELIKKLEARIEKLEK